MIIFTHMKICESKPMIYVKYDVIYFSLKYPILRSWRSLNKLYVVNKWHPTSELCTNAEQSGNLAQQ